LSLDKEIRTSRDVTEHVVNALKLVQQVDDSTTLKAATALFRGTKTTKGSENPFFGIGSDWSLGDAERLFEKMMIENLFGEVHRANGAGYTNSYVCVSRVVILSDCEPGAHLVYLVDSSVEIISLT
jgi:superfamily II DNA helicase RecQ